MSVPSPDFKNGKTLKDFALSFKPLTLPLLRRTDFNKCPKSGSKLHEYLLITESTINLRPF